MIHQRQPARLIDISPVVSERIGVFPGDTPFRRNVALDLEKGHNIGLSSIATTLHVGAHADAPIHYQKKGAGIEERDVRRYLGRCQVLHARGHHPGSRVGLQHVGGLAPNIERVLVKTESFPNPDRWNSDFCSFDPDLIEAWALNGVRLIGLDTPSIDPETSADLPSHHVVARFDMSILEGLVLRDVPEGVYTLIALPLKIERADASPVRAVLIDDAGVSFP